MRRGEVSSAAGEALFWGVAFDANGEESGKDASEMARSAGGISVGEFCILSGVHSEVCAV